MLALPIGLAGQPRIHAPINEWQYVANYGADRAGCDAAAQPLTEEQRLILEAYGRVALDAPGFKVSRQQAGEKLCVPVRNGEIVWP